MAIRTETKTVYYTSNGEEFDSAEKAEKQEIIDNICDYCGSSCPDVEEVVEYFMQRYNLTGDGGAT